MPAATPDRPAPRERLLAAADELFYAEGVQSVGIDRVIARAAVAKASLYRAFGSKDALVQGYLEGRSAGWRAFVEEELPRRFATPREQVVGVYALLGEWFAAPGYHGCPFINASAEAAPGCPVAEATATHRAWVRGLLAGLADEAGARDPDAVATALVLLYDGAMVAAQLDGDPSVAEAAQVAAGAVLDAAT